jgi:hypothetical protein
LGYWVKSFTPGEKAEYASTLSSTLAKLIRSVHSIEFQTPVYCTFENMLAFKIEISLPS